MNDTNIEISAQTAEIVEDIADEIPQKTESSGYRVTNHATVALQIHDVKLKSGRSAYFKTFDSESAKYAAWINANMISFVKS